jgi:hypothetical protein
MFGLNARQSEFLGVMERGYLLTEANAGTSGMFG